MTLVVVASNFLVQFPLNAELAGINLADILTWGAFTYPVAFLITDLTNRQFGPQAARKVVVRRLCRRRGAVLLHLGAAYRDRFRLGLSGRPAARYLGLQPPAPSGLVARAARSAR